MNIEHICHKIRPCDYDDYMNKQREISEFCNILSTIYYGKYSQLPHCEKVLNDYIFNNLKLDIQYYNIKLIAVDDLGDFELLYKGKPYQIPLYKKVFYKITNFLKITNKNLSNLPIDVSVEAFNSSRPYYISPDYPNSSSKCNNEIYLVNTGQKYKSDNANRYYLLLSSYKWYNKYDLEKSLQINNNLLILYVRNVMVDGKNCTLKCKFYVDTDSPWTYIRANQSPYENISLLGQSIFKSYLNNIKNYKKAVDTDLICNEKDTNYIPSEEELIMLSDYALMKNHMDIKDFFDNLLLKRELNEMKQTEQFVLSHDKYAQILNDINNLEIDKIKENTTENKTEE